MHILYACLCVNSTRQSNKTQINKAMFLGYSKSIIWTVLHIMTLRKDSAHTLRRSDNKSKRMSLTTRSHINQLYNLKTLSNFDKVCVQVDKYTIVLL
jgi:hypothetical protein